MRWIVSRPDCPPDLDPSTLQLIRSEEERREIYARIDAAVADPDTTWLAAITFVLAKPDLQPELIVKGTRWKRLTGTAPQAPRQTRQSR